MGDVEAETGMGLSQIYDGSAGFTDQRADKLQIERRCWSGSQWNSIKGDQAGQRHEGDWQQAVSRVATGKKR